MFKQYIKITLQSIRENPLISLISIAGTALALAMMMLEVLMFQVGNTNYAPETKRDRMLYVLGTEAVSLSSNFTNRGGMSSEVLRECFYSLETPEAVTASTNTTYKPVSLPGKRLFNAYAIRYTDANFWLVFDFRFLQGQPFTQEDFASGLCAAVISDNLAKELFGSLDVIGKSCVLDYVEYTIRGVVKNVPKAASDAYAEMWVPYSSKLSYMGVSDGFENISGSFRAFMLAKKRSDFKDITAELDRRVAAYNGGKKEHTVSFMDNPLQKRDIAMGSHGFNKVSAKTFLLSTGAFLLFLLLIPTFNLSGMVQSSIKKRQEEIGIRKAFGASSRKILSQVVWENFILTLIGAVLGLGLSIVFLILGNSFLLDRQTQITIGMLFTPGLFVSALVFTFLLNVLCCGLPALRISKRKIVESLKNEQ